MEKIYKTDRKGGVLTATILIIVGLGAAYLDIFFFGQNVSYSIMQTRTLFLFGFTLFLLYVILESYFGNYIVINNEGIIKVNHFFFKTFLSFNGIDEINYQQGFLFNPQPSKLCIIYKHNERLKYIVLGTKSFFNERTFSEVVKQIYKHNPQIKLDNYSRKLLEMGSIDKDKKVYFKSIIIPILIVGFVSLFIISLLFF